MTTDAAFKVAFILDRPRVNSVALVAPWWSNTQDVGAIASSVSALVAASALVVAVIAYLSNSRIAARNQAGRVTANRTRRGETRSINDRRYRLIEIHIRNSSQANIFDLSLLLRTNEWGAVPGGLPVDWASGLIVGIFGRPAWGCWMLGDGAVIPPGVSTLRIYVADDPLGESTPIAPSIAVGFVDENGRAWTRRLDGKLIKGWKMSSLFRSVDSTFRT